MPRPRSKEYDAPEFRKMWDTMPLRDIAEQLGVTAPAIHRAAMMRGFPPMVQTREEQFRAAFLAAAAKPDPDYLGICATWGPTYRLAPSRAMTIALEELGR